MGLYEQIKDVAKEKGFSINKLESELGFARSSIYKFNKNKPSMDKIQQIADFLGVSITRLTKKEDSEYIDNKLLTRSEKDLMKLFGITKEQYLSQEEFLIDGEKVTRKDIEFIFDTMYSLLENVKKRSKDNDV